MCAKSWLLRSRLGRYHVPAAGAGRGRRRRKKKPRDFYMQGSGEGYTTQRRGRQDIPTCSVYGTVVLRFGMVSANEDAVVQAPKDVLVPFVGPKRY
jgi:hypothetical protein